MLIGERFGKFPEECEQRPADRALFYNALLGVEGHAYQLIKGLHEGDQFVRLDDDG